MMNLDSRSRHRSHWRIAIFPGGTEVGLEIWKSLKDCKEIDLISVSSGVDNHAPFVFSKHFEIPDVRKENWIQALNGILRDEKIDFIYPANSLVIDALIAAGDRIASPVILAPKELVKLTRSKTKTLEHLRDFVPTPRKFSSMEEITEFPVYIKPDSMYGAQGTRLIENPEELLSIKDVFTNYLVQEYLSGEEYTVDCFSDSQGKLLFSEGRIRGRIRMGTTMHSYILEGQLKETLKKYAHIIAEKIPLTGGWFFQVRSDSQGVLRLLEVEARIAGTMCLNRARGVNFPLLSIMQSAGLNVSILLNDYRMTLDRSLANRFSISLEYSDVYVDLDDTLVCKGKVNVDLVRFIFQCRNHGKKVHLISKSLAADKMGFLKSYRLSELFDQVIWLKESDHKADYITSKSSIYIDDSFSQRADVAKKLSIPTFDPSMVEGLLDDRQ